MIMLCDRQKRAGCEGRCRQTWRRSSIMRRATGPSSRQRGHWSWQQQEDLRNLGKRQTAKNVTRSQRCIIREDLFVWTSIQEHGNKACARMSCLDLRVSDMQRKHNEVTAVVSQLKNCLIDSRLEHHADTRTGTSWVYKTWKPVHDNSQLTSQRFAIRSSIFIQLQEVFLNPEWTKSRLCSSDKLRRYHNTSLWFEIYFIFLNLLICTVFL